MEEKRIVKPWQAGLMLLVGTWMASGTVPVMIYYGMKVLTPGLFLPVVCILCHADVDHGGHVVGHARDGRRRLHGRCTGSRCAAARGRGRGLHRRVPSVTRSRRCLTRPYITATVCEVPLMDGIRHALISTGPAYLISLVFCFVYGLRYSGGSVGGEVYEDILSTVSAEFWLSPVLLLPVLVAVVLI